MTARLAVLVSGNGSNLQAILDACRKGTLDAKVELVASNNPLAFGLQRSAKAGIRTATCEPRSGESREEYDGRLVKVVQRAGPDWVVLAGWSRLLTMHFLARFQGQVINLHPALPGEYPGLQAIERAFADAQAGKRDYTGVMVHLVPDEGVDDGPVLATERVAIRPDDSLDSLTDRIHKVEHGLLVSTLATLSARSGPIPVRPRASAVRIQPLAAPTFEESPGSGDVDDSPTLTPRSEPPTQSISTDETPVVRAGARVAARERELSFDELVRSDRGASADELASALDDSQADAGSDDSRVRSAADADEEQRTTSSQRHDAGGVPKTGAVRRIVAVRRTGPGSRPTDS
jgi:phosphoribosylglycinamide formyltransferase 1